MAVITTSASIPSSLNTAPIPSTPQRVTVSTYGQLTPTNSAIPPSATSGGGGGGSIGTVQSGFGNLTPTPSTPTNVTSIQTPVAPVTTAIQPTTPAYVDSGITSYSPEYQQNIYRANAIQKMREAYERAGLTPPTQREMQEQVGIYTQAPTFEERAEQTGLLPSTKPSPSTTTYSSISILKDTGRGGTFGTEVQRKTRMDLTPQKQNTPLYLTPTVVKEYTGTETITTSKGDASVPFYKYTKIDPYGTSLGGGGYASTATPASASEIALLESQTRELQAKTETGFLEPTIVNIQEKVSPVLKSVSESPPIQVAGKLYSNVEERWNALNEMVRQSAGIPTAQEIWGGNTNSIFRPIYSSLVEKPLTIPSLIVGGEIIGAGAGIVSTARSAVGIGGGIVARTTIGRTAGAIRKTAAFLVPMGITAYGDISSSSSPEEAVGKLITSGLEFYAFGKGFEKGYKIITEPIITKYVPQKVTNIAVETGYNLQVEERNLLSGRATEKIIPISDRLEQFSYVEPPKAEITTRGRQFLGIEPLQEFGYVKQPYVVRTSKLFASPLREPYSAAEVGHGRGTLYTDTFGTSKVISPEDINIGSFTPIEKKMFSELAGLRTEAKLPLTEEISPLNLFSKEGRFVVGEVSREKTATRLGFTKPSARVSKTSYLAYVEEIPSAEEGIRQTISQIVYKDITKPFSRASGKISNQTVISRFRETPIKVGRQADFLSEPSTVESLTKNVRITPEGKVAREITFEGQIKNIDELSKVAVKTSVDTGVKNVPKVSFEKAAENIPFENLIKEKISVKSPPAKISETRIKLPSAQSPQVRLFPVLTTEQSSATMQNQEVRFISTNIAVQTQPPVQDSVIRQSTKQLQQQSQAQTELKIRTEMKTPPPPISIIDINYPPYDINYPPKFSFGGKKRKFVPKKKVKTYSVLLRKKGKFVPIATGLERGKALKFGSESALKDIARTFRITESGTKEVSYFDSTPYLPSDKSFRGYVVRRGKKISTPNQFIQRASANLQSQQEKLQIAEAKKLKKLIGNL